MISHAKQSVIIVAGGKGLRAGGDQPKQFQPVGGIPVLMHAMLAFYRYNEQMKIVVVLPEGFHTLWKELCLLHDCKVPHIVVPGGDTRFQSVRNGLEEIADEEIVGVHDAARPFVSNALIGRCFEAASQCDCGVVPVVEEINSVRMLTETGSSIINRQLLRVVQTPQVFQATALKKAYQTSYDPAFTDDASVAEKDGIPIQLVEGEECNFKITTPFDWILAESWYQYFVKTTE